MQINYSKNLRTNLLITALLLLVIGCVRAPIEKAPIILSEASADSSWSTHLSGPERTNSVTDNIALPPEDSWKKRITSISSSVDYNLSSAIASPVIDGERIFIGSPDNKFISFYLSSGKRDWSFKPGSPVYGGATVKGNIICFGTAGAVLYCLDKNTGDELWKFDVRAEIRSAPVITDDSLFFSSSNNRFYALDVKTGEKLWSYTNASSIYVSGRVNNSPAYSEGRLFVIFPDGSLVALDAKSGKELWKERVISGNMSLHHQRTTPLVYDRLVYVIDDTGTIVSFDVADGKKKTSYGLVRAIDFIVDADEIYIASAERLIAVDRETASLTWKIKLTHGEPRSILLAGKHIFVLSNFEYTPFNIKRLKTTAGYVAAYKVDKGKEVWGEKISSEFRANAAALKNHLAVVTTNGNLIVFGPE